MKSVLCPFLDIYLIIMVLRAVMSWFTPRPGTPLGTMYRVLVDLTEPVAAPLRRVIPPAGMFDVSFMVLFFAILILMRAINCPAAII